MIHHLPLPAIQEAQTNQEGKIRETRREVEGAEIKVSHSSEPLTRNRKGNA